MKILQDDVLTFNNITFGYGTENILENLDFRVKPGEFVSIIGASGTGKSTIFRLIVGLEQPKTGTILFRGIEEKERLGKVGYMPQQDLLLPWRNVLDNVCLPLEAKGRKVDKTPVIEQLKTVGLADVIYRYPNELSGGMRQRVSFLRASQSKADLLLLDEPFSALDAMTKLHMQEWLLAQWDRQKTSIVFITHDISEALFLSDRILVIRDTPIHEVEEIIVPLPRPRERELLDQPEIIALKNDLMNSFQMRESS